MEVIEDDDLEQMEDLVIDHNFEIKRLSTDY
jgi:hypothetical protein